ncbi:MAG: VOC family protein [Caulobacteraceae bacterium]|nr:MAG: VOC family protein [Caulobacteraceae bacterium]
MQQQMSVVTLGIDDVARSKRFYAEGFGWTPVWENEDVVFYQMNGFVLGTWLRGALAKDSGRSVAGPGDFALAHNVQDGPTVARLLDALVAAGGSLLRAAEQPPQGGMNGYVADPDGHAWEIAWNPAWPISPEGYVTFGV